MKSEFEVKLLTIDVDALREQLVTLGAVCILPRTLMKRVVFNHP
jgi:hypothetical protein